MHRFHRWALLAALDVVWACLVFRAMIVAMVLLLASVISQEQCRKSWDNIDEYGVLSEVCRNDIVRIGLMFDEAVNRRAREEGK